MSEKFSSGTINSKKHTKINQLSPEMLKIFIQYDFVIHILDSSEYVIKVSLPGSFSDKKWDKKGNISNVN